MTNKVLIEQTRDRLVRDLTAVGYPMAKSEVRRTLNSLLELQRQAIIEDICEEFSEFDDVIREILEIIKSV